MHPRVLKEKAGEIAIPLSFIFENSWLSQVSGERKTSLSFFRRAERKIWGITGQWASLGISPRYFKLRDTLSLLKNMKDKEVT